MSLVGTAERRPRKAPRIWIYGTPGIGKTTLAARWPGNPFLVDIEGGCDGIDVMATPHTLKCTAEVKACLRELGETEHNFNAVIIDSTSALQKLVWAEVAAKYGKKSVGEVDWGKGYAAAAEHFADIIKALDWLRELKNMAVILIGHAHIQRVEPPDGDAYDSYTPRLHESKNGGALTLVAEWCDAIMFASYRRDTIMKEAGAGKTVTKAIGTGDRFLRTEERPYCVAKNRYDWPFEIDMPRDFDWTQLFPTMKPRKEK